MAVKTTLTLDNKADYDLLVNVLEERANAMRVALDKRPDELAHSVRRELMAQHHRLENLIKQVS